MTQNNQNIAFEHDEKDTVFAPAHDLQIIMQGGLPVSVIVPMEEYDRMAMTIDLAQELLEGKDFLLADGTKGTFQEMVEQRVVAERAAYEEELAAMFEEDCDQDCDEACEQEEQN
jgi:hypothetical protein